MGIGTSYPDEEVVQYDVEGCTYEENDEGGGKLALRLYISLACLESSVSGCTDDENLQVLTGQSSRLFLRHNCLNDLRSEKPYDCNGHCDGPEEIYHPLKLQPDQSLLS